MPLCLLSVCFCDVPLEMLSFLHALHHFIKYILRWSRQCHIKCNVVMNKYMGVDKQSNKVLNKQTKNKKRMKIKVQGD